MGKYGGYILAGILVVASVLAITSVQAATVAQMYCKQYYIGWYISDDAGIEVMGHPEDLLNNEDIRNFIMGINAKASEVKYMDVCTPPEEERGENI